MAKKPTYEELEQKVNELEEETIKRKQSEEQLIQMAQEMQIIFDTTNDAIWVLDQDMRIQRANKKAEQLFQHPAKEMVGKHCWEIAHGSEQPIPECPNIRAKHSLCRETTDLQVGESWFQINVDPFIDKNHKYGGAVHILTDVTELKLSEIKLRKKEERFKFLAENMADIVWTIDMDFNATYVSPSIEKILGFTPEERKQQKLEDMVTPESLEWIMKKFTEELRRVEELGFDPNRSITIDVEYFHRNGSIVWMENILKWIRNIEGAIIGIYGASRDITERRNAQQALRESEKKYQDLYDNAPDMFVSVDANTKTISQCNQTLAKLLGYKKEEIIGRPVFDIYTPDSAEYAKSTLFPAFVKTGTIKAEELQLQRKDGSTIDVSLNVSAIRDKKGNILQSRSILRDITDRKRAEKALAEKTALLDNILRNARKTAIVTIDLDFRINYYNPMAEKFFGYTVDDVIGKTVQEMHTEENVSADRLEKALEQVRRNGEYLYSLEQDTDNGKRYIDSQVSGIFDHTGELVGYSLFRWDVTDQKEAEKVILQASRMESISTLTGGIAHDFNNLLSVIMGNIELAEDEMKPDAGVSEYLKHAGEASLRAKKLIKQLIAFSKGGAPIKEIGSIGDLIKETTNLVLADTNVKCELGLPHEFWPVEFDEDQMKHAVRNLIVNAVESMPDGGAIVVKVENFNVTAKQVLPITTGRYIKISIQDQGRGISEEHLPVVFDPYFSTKEMGVQQGMGLSLATTYSIMNRHDGHIAVESEVGVGTIFTLYLPAYNKKPSKR